MEIGQKVKIIDPHDMNYRCKGKIVSREEEWDTTYEGVEFKMVKVDLGKMRDWCGKRIHVPNVVPYAMHQLQEVK